VDGGLSVNEKPVNAEGPLRSSWWCCMLCSAAASKKNEEEAKKSE